MKSVLEAINAFIWGIPVLILILVLGISLSIKSNFVQIRLFPKALHYFLSSFKRQPDNEQGPSGYRALCTALAATVGTGNIAGVAGAIAIGGPGVIFWMWICALLGMITKFAEVTLAVKYRIKDSSGTFVGGPMYMIENALPSNAHFLAYIYCFFGIVASFGVGNATQVNAVVGGLKSIAEDYHYNFNLLHAFITGVLVAALVTVAFRKGAGKIGEWAEKLVPFASIIYILLSMGVLILRAPHIPAAISSIITGAFSPKTVTCGVVVSVFHTLRIGTSRGVFTNEAGIGTASIAHAAANTDHPVTQGLMGIIEVFLDTIVICTMTALVILCSGVTVPYGTDPGIALTMDAFADVLGDWSRSLITALTCLFAFATILGWGLYGARCAQYLFGEGVWKKFAYAQSFAVILGAVMNTSVVWVLAEIVNGCMAIPNLIVLAYLNPVFLSLIKTYQKYEKRTDGKSVRLKINPEELNECHRLSGM